MYDLKIEVVEIKGFCDLPLHVGDYILIQGGRLYIPKGNYFCVWALQSILPFLSAKQRRIEESNDWLKHTSRMVCPDPHGRVILQIKRIDAENREKKVPPPEKRNKHSGSSRPTKQQAHTPRRLLVSEEDCTGCRRCELACSYSKTGQYSHVASRIKVLNDSIHQIVRPLVCHQCGIGACVNVCPQDALTRDAKTHAVIVDRQSCTNCGKCAEACPFGVISFNQDGYPLICDLCGGNPVCVHACPTGAISFGRAGDTNEKTNLP